MARQVREIDRGWNRIKRAFTGKNKGGASRVGIQGPEATKQDHAGITNVKVGAAHEFGAGRIPERSYMRSTFDKHRKKYDRDMKKAGQDVVAGTTTMAAELRMIGEEYIADIKDRVRGMEIKQDLAQRTEDLRGESGPALWVTGQLMGSLDVELER